MSVDREESGHGSAGEAVLHYCGFVPVPEPVVWDLECASVCSLLEVLQPTLLYLSKSNKLENIILLMKFPSSLSYFPS